MLLAVKILAAILFYGAAIEPRFVQTKAEQGTVTQLPPAWEGKQVAVLADLQVGMWWANTDAARRAVARAVDAKPALVLLAGDYVYEADEKVPRQLEVVLDIVQPLLDAHIPTYGVLGNHDYSLFNEHSEQENAVAHRVRVTLDSAGVHMLDNRAVPLTLPSPNDSTKRDTLWLVGIGEKWAKNDRIDRAFAGVPAAAPRLVFMHDPDSFVKIPAGAAPLAIASHTHGMQLGIPWLSDYLWRKYYSDTGSGVEGWVHTNGQPGNRLYVNRGIGFSIVPLRIDAVPELTLMTLTSGGSAQPAATPKPTSAPGTAPPPPTTSGTPPAPAAYP